MTALHVVWNAARTVVWREIAGCLDGTPAWASQYEAEIALGQESGAVLGSAKAQELVMASMSTHKSS